MPELPEVEALAQFLAGRASGRRIDRIELGAIAALKTVAPPLDALIGGSVTGCGRRGKYLLLAVAPVSGDVLTLALHLARGGWVQWRETLTTARLKPGRSPLALRVGFDDLSGFDVTEAGTEKRLSISVVSDPQDIEFVARLGPDPLDPAFDAAALASVLASRPSQVKGVLTDQSAIAGVGNAYSDEALHMARLSPFKKASALTPDEVGRLHSALVTVLGEAVARSSGVPASGLKGEKRSGMRVHGRAGAACPVCGDTVREVSFATKSLQYCPTCQTGGKPLADRRMSRLLK